MASRALRKRFSTALPLEAPVQLSLAVAPAGSPPPAPPATPRSQTASSPALPELWLAVHLPHADPAMLPRLGKLAQRFTPRVSLEPPDGLVLEVQGSVALFGGLARLCRAFRAGCAAAGVAPVLTVAPTPLAALVAARSGVAAFRVLESQQLVSAVSGLPLSAMRWPLQVLQRLSKLGVYRIGQALRLPRAGFARRFGVETLQMLDQLTARSADLRTPFRVPERFRAKRQFVREREHHGEILQALQPLLAQLAQFLEARQCGVTRITCRLRHRNGLHTDCIVRLAQPEAVAARLQEWFAERLGKLALPGAVRSLELRSGELQSRVPLEESLWRPGEYGGGAQQGLKSGSLELIERLRLRLGEQAVQGLTCQDSHCPEGASRAVSPLDPQFQRPGTAIGSAAALARPLWLLSEPELLQEREGWPQRSGPLRLGQGPERIESQWWAQGIARDYYQAIDRHGIAMWIFRERHSPHRWFLHGLAG